MPLRPDITFLNNYFDHIYILSLKRATDRHEHFKNELNGLDYNVYYGQDKNDYDVEALKSSRIYNEAQARNNHRLGRPMSLGQICCSWSHRLIYEDILKNNFDRVLILEDDVVIDKENALLLPDVFAELPPNWELLYLGFSKKENIPVHAWPKKLFYHFLRAFNGIKLTHKAISNLYPVKVSQHIYKSGYHDCTHAYALTASAAKKLIDIQTPISFIADHLLAYAVTNEIIHAYITLPKIINQINQVSTESSFSYVSDTGGA